MKCACGDSVFWSGLIVPTVVRAQRALTPHVRAHTVCARFHCRCGAQKGVPHTCRTPSSPPLKADKIMPRWVCSSPRASGWGKRRALLLPLRLLPTHPEKWSQRKLNNRDRTLEKSQSPTTWPRNCESPSHLFLPLHPLRTTPSPPMRSDLQEKNCPRWHFYPWRHGSPRRQLSKHAGGDGFLRWP